MNTICNVINKQNLVDSFLMLRTIDNETANLILECLKSKSKNQTEIMIEIFKVNKYISQSFLSNKLSELQSWDLIKAKRDGKNIYYSVNVKKFERIVNAINKFNAA